MSNTKRITGILPAATIAQQLAAMSLTQLMFAARELAARLDSDAACTLVLEELEKRIGGQSFEAFCAEIFA